MAFAPLLFAHHPINPCLKQEILNTFIKRAARGNYRVECPQKQEPQRNKQDLLRAKTKSIP